MDGEEIRSSGSGCSSTIKSSCIQFGKKIVDSRPVVVPEDEEIRLWYKRARCWRSDLLLPFFVGLVYIIDVGMDLKVAVMHANSGNPYWAAYTLAIVIFSLVVIEIVSVCWYLGDQRDPPKGRLLEQNGLEVKGWFYACHAVFFGRILRSWQIFKTVCLIRNIKKESLDDMWRCRLYVAQLHDSCTLTLLEAFTEEAPQITLQLYILVQKESLVSTSFADFFVWINIFKSLVFFAYNWLSYVRVLRLEHPQSELLRLFSLGSLAYFLWRLLMLVSRILAVVLFASLFKGWVFLVAGIHFILSCFIVHFQSCDYFPNEPIKQWFFKYTAITSVYIFCFFPLESHHTRKSGIPFYFMTFVENSAMVLLWYVFSDYDLWVKAVVFSVEWGTFSFGLLALALYYRCFHPSLRSTSATDEYIGQTEHDYIHEMHILPQVKYESSV